MPPWLTLATKDRSADETIPAAGETSGTRTVATTVPTTKANKDGFINLSNGVRGRTVIPVTRLREIPLEYAIFRGKIAVSQAVRGLFHNGKHIAWNQRIEAEDKHGEGAHRNREPWEWIGHDRRTLHVRRIDAHEHDAYDLQIHIRGDRRTENQ